MVIKCPKCSSRYKIDAAGLPDEGTYARCHKCENVFFVRKRSREEVARLRKSIREKQSDRGARPAIQHDLAQKPVAAPEPAMEAAGGDEFPSPPSIASAIRKTVTKAGADEKGRPAPPLVDESNIESFLSTYTPKQPEAERAEIGAAEEIPPVEPDESEEPTLNLSPDDIAALLAAHSPVNKTKIDELSAPQAGNEIEPLLNKRNEVFDKTLELTPSKAEPFIIEEESTSVSQDDIEALLSAHAPKPSAEPATAPKQESASVSQDDIEALLMANAPKPSAEPATAQKQESVSVSQDDIEALLMANAPKPSAEPSTAQKQESVSVSQDDIEALLSAHAPKPSAEPSTAQKQESASISQDDIEALLSAHAPKPSAEPSTAQKQESASVSQDDIEALLSAHAPKPSAEPATPKPAEEQTGKGVKSGIDQESIDALLAANAPTKPEAAAPAPPVSSQNDIDALLAANMPPTQSSAAQPGLGGQNEIDALLASAMGKPTPKSSAEPAKGGGEILSQADLDALLAKPAAKPEQQEKPREEAGIISQSDIDSILESAGFAEPEQAAKPETSKSADEGLLSQDTLDTLLSQAAEGEAEQPAEAFAPAMARSHDDELEKLLSGEEDSLGEALFQDSSKAASSTGEPSLDDLLASELTPREPATTREDEDIEGVVPGMFARGETEFASLEEEIGEEETPAKKRTFSPAALFAPIVKLFGKISFPKLNFIGALFHKLPPRLAGVAAGLALAMVVGGVAGGWWLLKGDKPAEVAQAPQKAPEQKPEAKPVAQPVKEEPSPSAQVASAPAAPTAEVKPVTQTPAPAVTPAAVSTAPSKARYPVSFVVYLPVEFDAESTRILNMNVELIFDSETMAKLARDRVFFSAVTVENMIDTFFRDKFYEETVFAQDKLEEFLAQNLKTVQQFAGLKDVRLSDFSID